MAADGSLPPSVTLVVFAGLPAAGKTTLASKLSDKLASMGHRTCVLSFDDFVPLDEQVPGTLGGLRAGRSSIRSGVEDYLCSCSEGVAGSCFSNDEEGVIRERVKSKLKMALGDEVGGSERKFVLVDDNNHYRSMRYVYYQLARDHGCAFAQVSSTKPINIF
jgi:tRNA uridine 5-carbamoylmethylation protein Kti12